MLLCRNGHKKGANMIIKLIGGGGYNLSHITKKGGSAL